MRPSQFHMGSDGAWRKVFVSTCESGPKRKLLNHLRHLRLFLSFVAGKSLLSGPSYGANYYRLQCFGMSGSPVASVLRYAASLASAHCNYSFPQPTPPSAPFLIPRRAAAASIVKITYLNSYGKNGDFLCTSHRRFTSLSS